MMLRRPINFLDFETVLKAMALISIDGDFMEFGVYRGGSIYPILKKSNELGRRFFALDSFEGFPQFDRNVNTFQWLPAEDFKDTSYDNVKKYVLQLGLDTTNFVLLKGWFDEILTDEFLTQWSLSRVAFAFIDCDIYESTVPILNFLEKVATTGTILAFDDYQGTGVEKATAEFLERTKRLTLEHLPSCDTSCGRAFRVVKA
jgi:hypothetical protein